MARRRSEDGFGDDERIDGDPEGIAGILGGGFGGGTKELLSGVPVREAPSIDGGGMDEFGNVLPDFSNDPNFPKPFVDYQPEEIAGNTDRPRDMRGPNATPNTFSLPQGVSVNEGMFSGVPQSGNAMNVPGQSRTPQLSSGNVMNAPPESGTSQGPIRRSASSPSIYGESASPTMFGRAGGLLGGGKGLVGAEESSGPIAPTEMMAKLLQLFRQQGGA